jgi:hypothetical protein
MMVHTASFPALLLRIKALVEEAVVAAVAAAVVVSLLVSIHYPITPLSLSVTMVHSHT